ncbi:hypothetical protein HOF56_01135 [Candidatus Peribacteria bacterium]|jgi:hypothetical protein|nr:hypothetical protein [Candidatus Peribacteria bacterium]MBT4020925.1 hypothetical protein [Candidatus Peribacteria bacterium]MBT4240483.1 hypothetical protein [Candidatus Peribacteria bacterium]MBT4474367.1 hypothetical protein [Candidatus Peribacteria bacterium]
MNQVIDSTDTGEDQIVIEMTTEFLSDLIARFFNVHSVRSDATLNQLGFSDGVLDSFSGFLKKLSLIKLSPKFRMSTRMRSAIDQVIDEIKTNRKASIADLATALTIKMTEAATCDCNERDENNYLGVVVLYLRECRSRFRERLANIAR